MTIILKQHQNQAEKRRKMKSLIIIQNYIKRKTQLPLDYAVMVKFVDMTE